MDTLTIARVTPSASDSEGTATASPRSQPTVQLQPVLPDPAFSPARKTPIDLLFTGHALIAGTKAENKEDTGSEDRNGRAGGSSGGGAYPVRLTQADRERINISTHAWYIPEIDRLANKISVDVNLTQKILPTLTPKNASAHSVNLLERLKIGAEALWRNPARMKISHWSRREMMHVFNGFFRQATDLYEDYATFGRCYTCPDPFKNDDAPWTNGFYCK